MVGIGRHLLGQLGDGVDRLAGLLLHRLSHGLERFLLFYLGEAAILFLLGTHPLGLDREDPAAKDDVTTVNQMYLPVNRPIIVRLKSKDVIHSFGVPEFRVKQDAIPGLTIPIWFVPTVTTAEMRSRTGKAEFKYEIACAQLCGLGHAQMRGFVTVQTPEEFKAWLDNEIVQQSAPDPFR